MYSIVSHTLVSTYYFPQITIVIVSRLFIGVPWGGKVLQREVRLRRLNKCNKVE